MISPSESKTDKFGAGGSRVSSDYERIREECFPATTKMIEAERIANIKAECALNCQPWTESISVGDTTPNGETVREIHPNECPEWSKYLQCIHYGALRVGASLVSTSSESDKSIEIKEASTWLHFLLAHLERAGITVDQGALQENRERIRNSKTVSETPAETV